MPIMSEKQRKLIENMKVDGHNKSARLEKERERYVAEIAKIDEQLADIGEEAEVFTVHMAQAIEDYDRIHGSDTIADVAPIVLDDPGKDKPAK